MGGLSNNSTSGEDDLRGPGAEPFPSTFGGTTSASTSISVSELSEIWDGGGAKNEVALKRDHLPLKTK
jgi:hypothetical protein